MPLCTQIVHNLTLQGAMRPEPFRANPPPPGNSYC
jgi:hypothetical protein